MKPPFSPVDQPTRDQAVTTHDTSFSVEAGAGTGKTALLTRRYLDLIAHNRARPSQIVAITFTDKAASELRDRIRVGLRNLNRSDLDEELDRAPIATIHAFASSLLRERPFDVGLDPNFVQMDQIASDLFLQACYAEWIPLGLAERSSVLARATGSGLRLDKVRDLAFHLYAHRDLLSSLPSPEPSQDLDAQREDLFREALSLWELASGACVDVTDEGYRSIQTLFEEAERVRNAPVAAQERSLLLRWEAKSKGVQAKWARPESCREQKKRMKELGERLASYKKSLRTEIFSELILWLSGFVSYVEGKKRREGCVDFDDLLFLARDMLRDHVDVRRHFQSRYRYFLVDEFQDTDPVQAEMIWWLSTQATTSHSWSELPLVPGKLFVVGDPKQSIYRFRRASIETYHGTSSRLAEQGERLLISQNFRTTDPLIGWINGVFREVLPGAYEPLAADPRHPTLANEPPAVILEAPLQRGKDTAPELRRLEAEAIASYLRALLADGKKRVRDLATNELRPVRLGDVALLFPTLTDIDIFEETLRRHDLPFALEGSRLFFHRTETHALVACLEAVAHPTDAISVVAALRSSIFGWSDQDLWTLSSQDVSFDYRQTPPSDLPPHMQEGLEILRDLHAQHLDLSPSELIRLLMQKTAAIPLALDRYHGEQAAANLEKMLALARRFEQQPIASLHHFVSWVRERRDRGGQQPESSLTEWSEARLRLSTIHKAKGLEFPVVVLANLSARAEQGEPVVADRFARTLAIGLGPKEERFSTSNYDLAAEAEKDRREEERRRLLYVGATRARDLLVLPRFLSRRHKAHTFWHLLDEGLPAVTEKTKIVPFEELQQLKKEPATVQVSSSASDPGTYEKAEVDFRQAVEERSSRHSRGLALSTPSDLVSHSFSSPSPGSKKAGGREFGSILHAVLEKLDPRRLDLLASLCRLEARRGRFPDLATSVHELLASALKTPFFERVVRSHRAYREVPFSWVREKKIFEGSIDLVFEEGGGLVVVDYKTDNITKEQMEARAQIYRPQLELYRAALEALTSQKVKESLIFFTVYILTNI